MTLVRFKFRVDGRSSGCQRKAKGRQMICRFELVLTSLAMASTMHAESTFTACPASFADLLADKVSTVLERGEEVPTASSLRHIDNIGK
jgi:hypothetical protein